MPPLHDIVGPEPRILFVGINPGLRSWEEGHHFAGRGNPFWRLLHLSGLVPVPLGCAEEDRLVEFGLGLTNLCPRATRTAAELTRAEVAQGVAALRERVRRWRPRIVAFVGVTIYRDVFGLATGGGAGEKPQTFEGARVFVLPNPSGINASYPGLQDKRVWFERLQAFDEALRLAAPDQRR